MDEPGVVTADMTPTPIPIETSTAAVSRRKARTPRIFSLKTSPQGVGQPGLTTPVGAVSRTSTRRRAKPVAKGPLLHTDSGGRTCGSSAEPQSV